MAKKVKQAGYEHIILKDDGEVAGVWTIDGHKVREEFGAKKYWEGIDEIIRLYTKINPNEIAVMNVHNQLERDSQNNEFGSNKAGAIRYALSLPYNLLLVLKDYDKDIIQDKKKRQTLMRRHPQLRTCHTV